MRAPKPPRYPHTSVSSCSRVKNHPGAGGEEGQDVELGRGEVDGLSAAGRPASGGVEFHTVDAQRSGGGGARAVHPAEDGMDPCDQLSGAEGFGEVVVGADGEADEEVGLRVSGREHEDGHWPLPLDPTAYLEAVEAGQHEVEDNEVGPDLLHKFDTGGPVGCDLHPEPLAAQPSSDGRGDGLLVFDHRHRVHANLGDHTPRIGIAPRRGLRDDVEISRRSPGTSCREEWAVAMPP